ncbi:heat-inducible transcription repressor hrcA [Firmicutes bacterium CAG:449]|nr:heat-inducible transcription repressor hrcA [Firmicutes bacterium CAG:449]
MLSRSDLILKYIVEYFVKTATPVGSNTLLENYDLPYSSATIRNEMAHLESLGYLEKTHTSSGRVPSSEGYRYYVKYLRDNNYHDVDEQIKNQLALILDKRSKSIEDVLKESCEILSHMTNLASVVLGPNADEEHLASIQVVPLSKNSATCLFVTDRGYVENKTFVFDENVSLNDLKKCIDMINERIKGTAISMLVDKMNAIKPLIQSMIHSNDALYRVFAEALIKFTNDRMALYGKENLLDQPEFNSDIQKFKEMLQFIDSPTEMKKLIDGEDSLQFHIGKDEEGNGLDDVSFVTKKIDIGGGKGGTITLVGPTRMDYDKISNALEYLAEQLMELYGDDDHRKDPS